MSTGRRRVFEHEFKVGVIERLMAGERAIDLSRELGISPGRVSTWRKVYGRLGPDGLRRAGRPRQGDGASGPGSRIEDLATARARIGELEHKVGQQQLELDFFRRALRSVGEARRPSDGLGVKASTPPSRR